MQQRGPPMLPIALSDFAVIQCGKENSSCDNGVGLAMMETNILTVDATGLAVLLFVAYRTLHQRVLFKIFQRRTANQAFFLVHNIILWQKYKKADV